MKVLLLGAFKSSEFLRRYNHPKDPGLGGSRKMALVARSLMAGGHEVRLISSRIAYCNEWKWQSVPTTTEISPEGRLTVLHASTCSRRPLGAALMCMMMPLKILWNVYKWNPDVIFCYNADFPEAIGSVLARILRGVRFVLEVDDVPGVRYSVFHPKGILDKLGWRLATKYADSFVVVNSAIQARVRVDSRRCLLLPGIIEDSLIWMAKGRQPPFSSRIRTVLYAGALSVERGSGRLLTALSNLPSGWRAIIAGSGPLATRFQEFAEGYPDKCEYLGLISPEVLFKKLVETDVVVNTPELLRDQAGVFPFKIFEYLICGAHVISTPLPKLDGLDLDWLQRWSGEPDDLIRLLNSSIADFTRFAPERDRSRNQTIERYSLSSVSGKMTEQIQGAKVEPAVEVLR
jgi:glycosyltransferase involved in cell wall biosynthesis